VPNQYVNDRYSTSFSQNKAIKIGTSKRLDFTTNKLMKDTPGPGEHNAEKCKEALENTRKSLVKYLSNQGNLPKHQRLITNSPC